MPIRLFPSETTSNGITSKKSPPTSFAITLFPATSKPSTLGMFFGRKLCWISAAIASSVFFFATSLTSVSRSACIFRSFSRFFMMNAKIRTPMAFASTIGIQMVLTRARAAENGCAIMSVKSMCRLSMSTAKATGNEDRDEFFPVRKPDDAAQKPGKDRGDNAGDDREPAKEKRGRLQPMSPAAEPDHRAAHKAADHGAEVADVDDRAQDLDSAHRAVDGKGAKEDDQKDLDLNRGMAFEYAYEEFAPGQQVCGDNDHAHQLDHCKEKGEE